MIRNKSAGGIVLNKENKIIIVNNKGKSWTYPKGHIEEGETALEAAKREIYEETGVKTLKLIKSLNSYERVKFKRKNNSFYSKIKEIFMFVFETDQDDLVPFDSSNPLALWVPKEDVIDLLTYKEDKSFFLDNLDKF
ncbi:MAG: hypothetical protein BAJALOKI2v1_30038 [Promethearchaeota archaeon]|nr:MAG: hypothetical protein BAJALOKI2v1_30038 [Candidatus Lokiarchaeota archaeon]